MEADLAISKHKNTLRIILPANAKSDIIVGSIRVVKIFL